MRWLELTVESGNEAVEAVSEILCRLGRGASVQATRLLTDPGDELAAREDPAAPYRVTAHLPDDADARGHVDSTRRALWHLQAFGLGPVGELNVTTVDDAEWLNGWRANYTPQRIGRLVIVPSWLDEPMRDGETQIRMDPGMAFGTGLHPSTRGCLTLLQGLETVPAAVLDVGSGSGILAIAALKLGAQQATCWDIDPVAVEATRLNAGLNGLEDRVTVSAGTLPERADARYRLVCANLVANVLIDLAERVARHTAPGGTLVAAGIIRERSADVERAFDAHGLTVVERIEDADWVSLRLLADRLDDVRRG